MSAVSSGFHPMRFWRSEVRLILSRRRNLAGMVVLASVPIILAVSVKLSSAGPSDGRGPDFISSITSNGIFVALASLGIETGLFFPLAIAALSGDAIAGEANIGTLRYLLTVPVTRTRMLAVKFFSLVTGAFAAVTVVAVTGVVAGGLIFGLGDVGLISGDTIPMVNGLGRLLLALAYLTVQLSALAAVGLFISTLTEQPIGAMIAIVIFSTASWILNSIPQLDWLHPWLLVNRWNAFSDLMRNPIRWDVMLTGIWVALAYAAVFLTGAWARFASKDITS